MKQLHFSSTVVRLRTWLLALPMMLMAFALSAQTRVTGKVTDENGEGLPGVSVLEKGTRNGTVSDINGVYNITVQANATLTFSYTGYIAQDVGVGSRSTVDVAMAPNDALISELVITGYTVDTRRQTTSAVATVKPRDLTAVPTGNVEQQLQGRVSGLTVITNGQPGTESQVRIRGFGSFFGNRPLYIVDGVRTLNIDFLSPDDVANTTVMKDASSASIYGASAASGVIIITTKKGTKKPQPIQVTYDAVFGWTNPGKGLEILNPQEQADWTWTALKNAGVPTEHDQYGKGATPVLPDFINVGGRGGLKESDIDLNAELAKYNVNPEKGSIYQVVRANKAGTDWYDAITRTAPLMRHNLGFQGSTESARYYLGMSVQEQSGILKYNDFKRYALRANSEFDVFKKFRVGENMQVTYRSVLGQLGGGGGANVAQDENPILGAFRMPAIIPVYDEKGGYAGTAAKGFNNPRNPVAERDGLKDNRGHGINLFGNVYAEYDLLSNLTLKTSIGGNYGSFGGFGYTRISYENSENNGSFGYNEFYGNISSWIWTNTAQYKKTFGEHNLEVLVGQEALRQDKGRIIDASGLNPFSQDPTYVTLSTVSNRVVNSTNLNASTIYSIFGRAHYGFRDKYYLTAVVRRDGSSRFGPTTRFGVFPGVSAAWRVTGEEFLSGSTWLDDLKIRGGWGKMGNDQPVSPTNQYTLFAPSVGDAAYAIDGSNGSVAEGYYRNQIGNPNAKWEVSATSNIGFDALILDGKFDIVLDFWQKKTSDLLFNPKQADVIGSFANAPFKNVSEMVNKGIDLQIVNKGKFGSNAGYELTLTGSVLKNEIVSVAEGIDYFDVNPASNRLAGTMVRNQVGYSISAFYGYQVVGLFQTQEEVTGAPKQDGAGVGRFRYADLNGYDEETGKLTGIPDGKIDAADRTYIGSPVPDFTGGLNFKVTFGQFDVETYMYTSIGNKIFNLSKWFTDFYPSFKGAAIGARVKDSWSTTNAGSENPIFEDVSNFSTNTQPNSWYVEDGSYFRLQNLSIGYNLPRELMRRLRVSRGRVFASTNNLLTITKYKGLDPSVGGAVDTNFGIDVGNYPITRQVLVGVGVTF